MNTTAFSKIQIPSVFSEIKSKNTENSPQKNSSTHTVLVVPGGI
jgi:hypothetical protein